MRRNFPGNIVFFYHLLNPRRYTSRVSHYYLFLDDLFGTLSEQSGIFNLGYAENPKNAGLTEAQRNLVRMSVRDLPRSGRWLDVGCGVGGPACLLARETPDIFITGINISLKQLHQARTRVSDAGLDSRIEFSSGDALRIPFRDSSFHGLYAIETAFHYPDKAAFAREAYRVLDQGGRIAVADIIVKSEKHLFLDPLRIVIGKRFLSSTELFTREEWHHSIERAGFTDIRIEDVSARVFGLLYLWRERLHEHYGELKRLYPAFMLHLLSRNMKHLSKRSEKGPFGYILVTGRKE